MPKLPFVYVTSEPPELRAFLFRVFNRRCQYYPTSWLTRGPAGGSAVWLNHLLGRTILSRPDLILDGLEELL